MGTPLLKGTFQGCRGQHRSPSTHKITELSSVLVGFLLGMGLSSRFVCWCLSNCLPGRILSILLCIAVCPGVKGLEGWLGWGWSCFHGVLTYKCSLNVKEQCLLRALCVFGSFLVPRHNSPKNSLLRFFANPWGGWFELGGGKYRNKGGFGYRKKLIWEIKARRAS